jgi:hypothetical protein
MATFWSDVRFAARSLRKAPAFTSLAILVLAVVSERFWRTHLDADAGAVGRTVRLDGLPFTVVGVVPASFQILFPSDIWTPFPPRRTPEQRRQHYLQVIARLAPGRTIDDARADMSLVAENIARYAPKPTAIGRSPSSRFGRRLSAVSSAQPRWYSAAS